VPVAADEGRQSQAKAIQINDVMIDERLEMKP